MPKLAATLLILFFVIQSNAQVYINGNPHSIIKNITDSDEDIKTLMVKPTAGRKFSQGFNLWRSKNFSATIDLRNYDFQDVNFSRDSFHDSVILKSDNFQQHFNFQCNYLPGALDMRSSRFANVSRFDSSVFDEDAFFNTVKFGEPYFQWTKFKKSVYFDSVHFSHAVDFLMTEFDGLISFKDATFDPKATLNLTDLRLGPHAQFDFTNCLFPDTIYLTYNHEFPTIVNLNACNWVKRQGKRTWICFTGTDTIQQNKVKFELNQFQILLPESTNPPNSPTKSVSLDENLATTKALIDKYPTGSPDKEEAIRVDQTFKNEHKGWKYWFIHTFILNKYVSLNVSILLWLLLSTINWFFMLYLQMNRYVYKIQNLESPLTIRKSWYRSAIYTSAVFFGVLLSIDKMKFEKKFLFVWFMINYLSGLIMLFWMAKVIFQR